MGKYWKSERIQQGAVINTNTS